MSMLAIIPVFFITLFSHNSQQVLVWVSILTTHGHHQISVFVSACTYTGEVTQGTRAPDGLIGSLVI